MISFILFGVDIGQGEYLNNLEGTTKVIANAGKFENIELYLTGEPGSVQEIEISTNAFDNNPFFFELKNTIKKISVSLRNCEAGEEFGTDGR